MLKLHYLREFPNVSRQDDYPPAVWFQADNADTEGPIAGKILEAEKYDELLQHYYDLRGYDTRGIPTRATLETLGLSREADAAARYATLT
jgi:aldehyde:ferredoxin oxidoreductase